MHAVGGPWGILRTLQACTCLTNDVLSTVWALELPPQTLWMIIVTIRGPASEQRRPSVGHGDEPWEHDGWPPPPFSAPAAPNGCLVERPLPPQWLAPVSKLSHPGIGDDGHRPIKTGHEIQARVDRADEQQVQAEDAGHHLRGRQASLLHAQPLNNVRSIDSRLESCWVAMRSRCALKASHAHVRAIFCDGPSHNPTESRRYSNRALRKAWSIITGISQHGHSPNVGVSARTRRTRTAPAKQCQYCATRLREGGDVRRPLVHDRMKA